MHFHHVDRAEIRSAPTAAFSFQNCRPQNIDDHEELHDFLFINVVNCILNAWGLRGLGRGRLEVGSVPVIIWFDNHGTSNTAFRVDKEISIYFFYISIFFLERIQNGLRTVFLLVDHSYFMAYMYGRSWESALLATGWLRI